MDTRTERDPLGEHAVPADAYYGIQTARAVENFPISGLRAHPDLVTATVLIKKAAAHANMTLGRLDARVGERDRRGGRRGPGRAASRSVRGGRLPGRRRHVAQHERERGAGQPRGRAARRRARRLRAWSIPNDHVNMGQSTNDVFPTATRLALLLGTAPLVAAARALARALARKAEAFDGVLKVGRTHLQDAVPMTLGQEFGGYAACIARGADDVERASRAAARAESRRDRRRHRAQRRRRLHGAAPCGISPRFTGQPRGARREPLPRHAEHGRRARLLGRDAPPGGGARQDRERPAAAQHGTARRPRRDHAAGRAARVVDHARQGEPVDPRDGEPGVLPGDRLRHDGVRRGRGRPARAERDDAGDRLERAALVDDPAQRDAGAARRAAWTASRPTPSAAASCSIAAPRSPRRSARTSATRRPRRSPRSRSGPAGRSASSCSSAGCWTPATADRVLSAEAMTEPGIAGEAVVTATA